MSIITVGIDLAKNVFSVHGGGESGKADLIKPRVAREQLLKLIAHLPRAIAPICHSAIGQSRHDSFTFNELCERLVNDGSIGSTLVFWARDGQESGGTFCGH